MYKGFALFDSISHEYFLSVISCQMTNMILKMCTSVTQLVVAFFSCIYKGFNIKISDVIFFIPLIAPKTFKMNIFDRDQDFGEYCTKLVNFSQA